MRRWAVPLVGWDAKTMQFAIVARVIARVHAPTLVDADRLATTLRV